MDSLFLRAPFSSSPLPSIYHLPPSGGNPPLSTCPIHFPLKPAGIWDQVSSSILMSHLFFLKARWDLDQVSSSMLMSHPSVYTVSVSITESLMHGRWKQPFHRSFKRHSCIPRIPLDCRTLRRLTRGYQNFSSYVLGLTFRGHIYPSDVFGFFEHSLTTLMFRISGC